ncbi:hypothetical protein [Nocardia sp. R6R-6]|uniref:hypothetical protein n=1 Tax=Nocardia sp. R6R-6 TaxID=3459303 RepID=UPI00403D8D25
MHLSEMADTFVAAVKANDHAVGRPSADDLNKVVMPKGASGVCTSKMSGRCARGRRHGNAEIAEVVRAIEDERV